jgi:hypothetical protein
VSFFSGIGLQQTPSLLVVEQQVFPQQQEEAVVPGEVAFFPTGAGGHAQTASGTLASSVEAAVANTTKEQNIRRSRRMVIPTYIMGLSLRFRQAQRNEPRLGSSGLDFSERTGMALGEWQRGRAAAANGRG